MQILITNTSGTWDVTQLVPTVKWSGDYQQAARTLTFTLLFSPTDATVPKVDCPLGAGVQLVVGSETLFDGFVFSRSAGTEGHTLEVTCFDRGIYLKRNKQSYKFTSLTPEEITARVCGDFGIALGHAASTGTRVSRVFPGNSLYDILATAYTLASKTTGKKYHIGFRGPRLYITEKAPDNRTLILQGKSNLISLSTTESIEGMVNAVRILDSKGNLVRTEEDAALIRQYGRLQEVVKQTEKDNKAAEVKRLLEDNRTSQKITVDNLGNVVNVTGGTVVIQEAHTGTYGLFWIDSDDHEWKRGQYYNKLVVNFRSIMDEKEAGSLSNAKGDSSDATGQWDYVNQTEYRREQNDAG